MTFGISFTLDGKDLPSGIHIHGMSAGINGNRNIRKRKRKAVQLQVERDCID